MQIALAGEGKAPAGVLGQGVQHVVEEADAGVDADCLRLARLRGVTVGAGDLEALVGLGRERAAVEVERNLDLGLVGVAREGGPADRGLGGGHCACGVCRLRLVTGRISGGGTVVLTVAKMLVSVQ